MDEDRRGRGRGRGGDEKQTQVEGIQEEKKVSVHEDYTEFQKDRIG